MITDIIDHANKLMTNCHWYRNRFLRPCVPVVNVHIGSTDRRFQDANEHVIATDFRNRNVLKPQCRLGLGFHDGFHHLLHEGKLSESTTQESRKTFEGTRDSSRSAATWTLEGVTS